MGEGRAVFFGLRDRGDERRLQRDRNSIGKGRLLGISTIRFSVVSNLYQFGPDYQEALSIALPVFHLIRNRC